MSRRIAAAAVTAAALIATAACSSSTPAATATSAATMAAATPTPAASTPSAATQPETAAAARAAARQFLGLYSAGQYAASWTLLAPSVKHKVSQAAWVGVHQGCPPQSAGLAYNVSKATMTGDTAVVTVSLSGAAAAIGSVSESLTYTAGRWGFVPSDLSSYGHGSVKADIAAAKAAGYCTRN